MEKRIGDKIETYNSSFKNAIKNYLDTNNISLVDDNKRECISDFLQFVYDYDSLILEKHDFLRRKRNKNTVPEYNRCCALRANSERCSRRRKGDKMFCGTHIKGIPYGSTLNTTNITEENKEKKVEVWIQEVNGIDWYIDEHLNVYDVNDIKTGIVNPKIIHKLKMNSNMEYEFCS